MIMNFIDTLRTNGYAVESICRVLRDKGCKIAARTYRAWRPRKPATRTVSDAYVVEAVRSTVSCTDGAGRRKMTPEGLYGRVITLISTGPYCPGCPTAQLTER